MIRIFGDSISGNCLKVKWVGERLGVAHEWIEIDILKGETRTDAFLALNPFGQVPVIQFDDGRTLSQSNAIILHLAEGSDLIPDAAFERAKMFEWMFWEQYSHEPTIAVRRFQKHYLKKSDDAIDADLMAKGRRALGRMEMALISSDFIAGGASLTLADISLLAYTRLAHEGGFDLGEFPAVHAWVARCERELGLPHVHEATHV
ncbi:MAG: glutathione S-transferase family protein [Hyphomonas sp.]|uniref:glutathione S-transferase family protein n=1 Tax=Hyphomonas sp. TaxID=87 RepID=UPI00185B1339|nr:glutathione S-transferase family protein [Hyphomonas sp.]MBU3919296.1 glutathione S-transferase family protein [Alphaproteobacteria bacterium]MBA3068499.1 glutathione S-transferase family protein [Hyphomonas sp.]MBU4060634.1 glutathione S-transferase family protein [Alphaproteobacteria bacterium]MBU4164618.1 glutathione S-transferase family protein [Alphaproteobacteria bacterium]MBU4569131.1 glutathione S-transferase family protein [Alphaproteobacteria bacterium]